MKNLRKWYALNWKSNNNGAKNEAAIIANQEKEEVSGKVMEHSERFKRGKLDEQVRIA